MNHITHDCTCYGVILLKLLQRIQQNCTDNSHLYHNYKLYFIHTYNVTNVTDTETQFENKSTFTTIQKHTTHILTLCQNKPQS